MALPEITLDDRRFEDIVEELKRRIPGYTPEWSDHNESDPGITLMQLNAWLAEMIIWRLNQVPEKNFVKFLQLIGIELGLPAAATVELSFTLTSKDLGESVLIRQGTQVSLSETVDGEPVVFETDEELHAVGGEVVALQSYDGARYQVLTASDPASGKAFLPLTARPQAGAALYVGLDRPWPPGQYWLTIHVQADRAIAESGIAADAAELSPPVDAVWEYWAGEARKWRSLAVVRDETYNLTTTGKVVFDAPTDAEAYRVGLFSSEDDSPLYWLRYRLREVLGAGYPSAPRLQDVLVNTVSATNAIRVRNELLGMSNGRPDQSFQLAHVPVLGGLDGGPALSIEVDEEEGYEEWQAVNDFSASTRTSKHYVAGLSTGVIRFGNGEQGKIPRWVERGNPIRAAFYRYGGGAQGNAGAGKVTSLDTAIPFVDSVTNLRPALGGEDEETVEKAKERAPRTIKSRNRAVTADDFEFFASQTPGARIARARALPLRHPRIESSRPSSVDGRDTSIPVPGVVTVIVVPRSEDPQPRPSIDVLELVAAHLNRFRLVTTELYVVGPRYREVAIQARIVADPRYSAGDVSVALEQGMLAYFHPLTGGADGQGWQFGYTIYFSETYRQILDTPGVLRIEANDLITFVDGEKQERCTDVRLADDELVFSRAHRFSVVHES